MRDFWPRNLAAKEALLSLGKREGDRSFFFYDVDRLKEHLASLAMPGVKLWYATKANPLSYIIASAVGADFGIDCASSGEIRQALRSGAKAENLLLTGPVKSRALLRESLALGVRTFVLESHRQLGDLDRACEEVKVKARALLRLQIPQKSGGASVLGGEETTVFGLGTEDWIRDWKNPRFVDVVGVHSFQWGNVMDPHRLKSIWSLVVVEAKKLASRLGFSISVIDFGGGIGISYRDEEEVSWNEIHKALEEVKSMANGAELWLELGRYAVGEFGWYGSAILDRKLSLGQNFLALSGGAHHLLRPALVGESFPCKASISDGETVDFSVHGPLCTALDQLGIFSLPALLEVGDYLFFAKCGAYGFTESMPYFLCHEGPEEWIWKNGALRQVRKSSAPEEWLV